MYFQRKKAIIVFVIFLFILFFYSAKSFSASKVDELKGQIEQKNKAMELIQKEIEEYKQKIATTAEEAGSLKKQITLLLNNLAQIKADIKFTQNRIDTASLTIEELSLSANNTEQNITEDIDAISELIRLVNEADSNSLIEIILANNNLSDFFSNLDNIQDLTKQIDLRLNELKKLRVNLEESKKKIIFEKENLENKKEELMDKKDIQVNVQKQKENLLTQTKNKESLYKNLLNDRIKKQEDLEKEMKLIEEALKVAISPDYLPKTGQGVLSWPVRDPVITQYFGNTEFATKNPQVYKGMGHNGIDLRASIGTQITASADGKVLDTGNTDAACKGVSYGKWVLIEHSNNLTTLYTHLSLIKVKNGDILKRGDVMGYSGDTGFVTGPHLHFAVFASKAVKADYVKSKVCGTMMKLPLAPYNGYLNPLSYL